MQVQQDRAPQFKDEAARRRFVSNFRLLRTGSLRCKAHGGELAVGICNRCGNGICRECMVSFGLKRYCRRDAESILSRTRALGEADVRGQTVTVAALLSFAEGGISGALGFLFILLGLLAPSMQQGSAAYSMVGANFAFFGPVFAFASQTLIVLGGVLFGAGLLFIAAGIMLWRSSKAAGLLTVSLAIVLALVSGTYFAVFAVVGLVVYVMIAMAVANVGTVLAGWGRLR